MLVEQRLEVLAELVVVRLVLESIVEDLTNKLLEFISAVGFVAKILHLVSKFDVADGLEGLVAVNLSINVKFGKLALTNEVDKEIAERDQVVSSARRVELKLIGAREDHVAAEHVNFGLAHMNRSVVLLIRSIFLVGALALHVLGRETEVHKVDRCVSEAVLIGSAL